MLACLSLPSFPPLKIFDEQRSSLFRAVLTDMAVTDARIVAILTINLWVSLLSISSWVDDVLFNMLWMSRYLKARASDLVEKTLCATQSPLCTKTIAFYDCWWPVPYICLCVFIDMLTPNILQDAEMMSTLFWSDSKVAYGFIRSSINAGLCSNIRSPDNPESNIISLLLWHMIMLASSLGSVLLVAWHLSQL